MSRDARPLVHLIQLHAVLQRRGDKVARIECIE